MMLPEMDHFMGEGSQDFLDRAVSEMRRIESYFIGPMAIFTAKTIR